MKVLFTMVREENIDPLNVELLSALARREGHETFLSILERGEVEDDIARIEPDVVAMSAKTGESNVFFRMNGAIRERWGDRVKLVMGGPHATFNHRRMSLFGEPVSALSSPSALPAHSESSSTPLPPEETNLDYLAVGEADESWPALLRALAAGESPDPIPGIVTRSNRRPDGTVRIRERTNFLDDLPFHDRELVYEQTQLARFPMRTFIAQRGCPYLCTYCFNARFNELYKGKGKTVNRYTVDRLLEELLDIKRKWPTQFIKFYDDMFTLRTDEWLLEFAEKYPKVIGLPFHCLTRCDLVRKDPTIVTTLKRAGLHSITMSIESGSDFIRKHIFRRGMSEEDIRYAFDLCHRHGIKTFSNTILAVPAPVIPDPSGADFDQKVGQLLEHLEQYFKIQTEAIRKELAAPAPLPLAARRSVVDQLHALGLRRRAIEYDIESIDLNVGCRVTSGEFVLLAPYPGTPLTDYTIATGAFDGDFEKLPETFQSESSFTCFTPEEKRQQLHLTLLGVPLLLFPWMRDFAVKRLVSLRLTKLYFLAYFLVRGYVVGRRMYPMRYSLGQLSGKIVSSFRREIFRHFGGRARRVPSDILGGPWKP